MLANLLRDQAPALRHGWEAELRARLLPLSSDLVEALPLVLARLESALRSGVITAPDIELEHEQVAVMDALLSVVLDAAKRAGLTLHHDEIRAVMQFVFAAGSTRPRRTRTESMNIQLVEAQSRVDELVGLARTSQAQLRLVIDALPFLISFVTHDERYGLVNKAYEDWFQVSSEDILGRRLVDVVGEAAYVRLRPFVLRGLAGERFTFEQRAIPYRSGRRDIRATFVPQHDDDGAVTGYVALLEDISWRLELEAERETMARERAEVLAKQADFERRLIGIVSHDLRNPLNVISLGSRLVLEADGLPPAVARHAQRVSNAADRATRLVDDLLDFAQARHGNGLTIERTTSELRSIVQGVVEEVQASWAERRIEIRHASLGVGMWDSDRIAQVVQNLVTNACKYSPPGSTVAVTVTETADEVALCVHNIGTPIPEDKLPILFEPYERAAAQTSAANRSVGLGLYIVKLIVEAHAGTVSVESTAHAGTTFIVALPRFAHGEEGT